MMTFIKQSWLVIAAALVFGLLVALVQGQLDPKIQENARRKLNRSMAALFLQKAEITDADMQTLKVEPVYAGAAGQGPAAYYRVSQAAGELTGYAFEAEGGGFADKIRLLVALDGSKSKLLGIGILKTNETPGFGDKMKEPKFKDQFTNKPVPKSGSRLTVVKRPVQQEMEIESITGATISSDAVTKIVNDAAIKMAGQIN